MQLAHVEAKLSLICEKLMEIPKGYASFDEYASAVVAHGAPKQSLTGLNIGSSMKRLGIGTLGSRASLSRASTLGRMSAGAVKRAVSRTSRSESGDGEVSATDGAGFECASVSTLSGNL